MLQKLHKAGRPIPDSEIYEFVQKSVKDSTDYLYERDLHPLFLEKFHIFQLFPFLGKNHHIYTFVLSTSNN